MEVVMGEESKPVLVRVKRKLYQESLDTFWLEVNQRPLKRAMLSLDALSISSSSGKEEETSRRFLMQHIDTVENPESTADALVSFLVGDGVMDECLRKNDERRNILKRQKLKQEQIHAGAVQRYEDMAKKACFQQIWKNRNGRQENNDSLHERYRLFDIVRLDSEDAMLEDVPESMNDSVEDTDAAILSNYLPLVKEFLPSAAAEIEREVCSKDSYVYDIYAMDDSINESDDIDNFKDHLLVQVVDDDDYDADDGQSGSDHDSDDSNAENSDLHDYPDDPSSSDSQKCETEDDDEGLYGYIDEPIFQYGGETSKNRDSVLKYEELIDVEELEMEIEELRRRYL